MLQFFEQTWFLWWMAVLIVILRWVHVVSANNAREDFTSDHCDSQSHAVSDQLHLFLR